MKLTMTEGTLGGNFVHLGLDLDAAGVFHRLRCVVAEIEDHLLQLGKLARHDGRRRRFMDRKIDPRRQRDIQQRLRLGNQSPRAEGPTTRVAAASERQNLVDEIARPLRASANRTEIAKQPSVRTEVLFYHFRMAENPAQNIVEVMGQTTGECAYRLHAA